MKCLAIVVLLMMLYWVMMVKENTELSVSMLVCLVGHKKSSSHFILCSRNGTTSSTVRITDSHLIQVESQLSIWPLCSQSLLLRSRMYFVWSAACTSKTPSLAFGSVALLTALWCSYSSAFLCRRNAIAFETSSIVGSGSTEPALLPFLANSSVFLMQNTPEFPGSRETPLNSDKISRR